MIYSINVAYNNRMSREVEADTQEDADRIAKAMADELLEEIKTSTLAINPTIRESDRNFVLNYGSIYLVKRYSHNVPAKCLDSRHIYSYRGREFKHTFEYLDSKKMCRLYGKNPPRLLGKICGDYGRIGKRCDGCVARFSCYTRRV